MKEMRMMKMNRTAKCIQMLCLLSENDIIKTGDLAKKLDSNPRNIREYRKELEEAGFQIRYTTGKFGGYSLEGARIHVE